MPDVINLCDDDSESTAQLTFLFDLPAEVLENILVLLLRLDKKSPRSARVAKAWANTTRVAPWSRQGRSRSDSWTRFDRKPCTYPARL